MVCRKIVLYILGHRSLQSCKGLKVRLRLLSVSGLRHLQVTCLAEYTVSWSGNTALERDNCLPVSLQR